MAVHKYLYIGLIVLCLCAGPYGYYTGSRNQDLDNRITELTAENERIGAALSDVTEELRETTERLQDSNEQLEQYTADAGEITTGLSELGEGLQGVIDGMRAYTEKK